MDIKDLKRFRQNRQRKSEFTTVIEGRAESAFSEARRYLEQRNTDAFYPYHQDELVDPSETDHFELDVLGFTPQFFAEREFEGLAIETLPARRRGKPVLDVLVLDNNDRHYREQVAALALGPLPEEETKNDRSFCHAPGLAFGEPGQPSYYQQLPELTRYSSFFSPDDRRVLMMLQGQAYHLCQELDLSSPRSRIIGWGALLALHGLKEPGDYRERLNTAVKKQGRFGGNIDQCWPHLVANEIVRKTVREKRSALNSLMEEGRSTHDFVGRGSPEKDLTEILA